MAGRRALFAVLALTAVLLGTYPWLAPILQRVAYDAAGVPLALVATVLVRRASPRLRIPAILAAAGAWLLVAGAVVWDVVAATGQDPADGLADVCFVLGTAAGLAALLAAVQALYPNQRGDLAMLALAVTPLSAVLAWALRPEFDATVDTAELAALAMAVFNTLATTVATRLFSAGGWRNPVAWLVVVGFGLRAAGDLLYLALQDFAVFKAGDLLDLTWMAGKLLLAAALVHPRLPELVTRRVPGPARLGQGQAASMLALVLIAPAVSTLPFSDGRGRLMVAAAGALAGVLAVTRLVLLTVRIDRASRELAASQKRYRQLFHGNSAVMLLVDPDDASIVSANPAAATFYGWSVEELTRMKVHDLNLLSAEELRPRLAEVRAGQERFYRFQHRRADGSVRDVEVFTGPVTIDGRDLLYSTVHDVSSLRREREARKAAEGLAYALLDQRVIGVATTSGPEHRLDWVNERLVEMLGLGGETLRARPVLELAHPEDRVALAELLDRVTAGQISSGEHELRLLRDNATVHVLVTAAVLPGTAGGADLLLMVQDISDRRAVEEQMRHQALHDPLTGLPNRTLLLDRVTHALERTQRRTEPMAVLFMDLDRFKAANDAFGHDLGDKLLREVAGRLSGCVRSGDTLARLGGDEFAVLCEATDVESALVLARRLLDGLAKPFTVDGHRLHVSASIGLAPALPGTSANQLLRDADLAMYHAKDRGGGGVEVFAPSLHTARLAQAELDASLHAGLANGEFLVYYQPLLTLNDLRPVAVEALVRWRHPARGVLPPADFIPAAEANGLIVPLGLHVLREACRQAGAWLRAGLPVEVSVNLSTLQFRDPALPVAVRAALADAALPPHLLALEITESILMDDAQSTLTALDALAAVGVRLLVDDFGTGYSSLAYLKRFPVHGLKIDRSFVDGVASESLDRSIVTAITQLARALDLDVIAEGIEKREQVTALAELGCHTGQGFLFSKPVAADVAEEFLRSRRTATVRPG